jgi:DNA polymerase III epsilon subunit-like protein
MSLLRSPVLVLDTETTGFPKNSYARIWDLGAVLLGIDGQVLEEWQRVIVPDPLDDRANPALAIGGVTQDWIRENGIPEAVAVAEWTAFLERTGPVRCTAFNNEFDRPMMERCGFGKSLQWGRCLMRLAQDEMGPAGALPRWENGEYKFPKLSEAANYYAIQQQEPAHRALADAKTAALILLKIQARKLDATK